MKISSLNLNNIVSSLKFCAVIPFALVGRKFNKNVWIVTERPDQARDNGYLFYKYLRENQKQCNVYYIIDKTKKDYDKIKRFGNIIQFNSIKHYYYYCLSKMHISAHIGGCKPLFSPICTKIKNLLHIKDVFIPHGVSYGVSEFCLQKYAKIDLFICSGKLEYDNVLANYGYTKNEVAYTGFPRLDAWHNINVNKKQIVLMPTWRLYLAQNPNTIFTETTYFTAYNKLINDKKLGEFLSSNQIKLVFYLHNNMRQYVADFSTACKNIEVVDNDEAYDIQELLKESALLITDYSSVHFDFAYMNKPVLYFQFDKKEFYENQYSQGIFDVEKDGFGKVAYDNDTLVNNVIDAYKSNFEMDKLYYQRMRNFYQLYDDKNCQRVYEKIMELNGDSI